MMALVFEELLDATIEHLEHLKEEGQTCIQVDPQSVETLRELRQQTSTVRSPSRSKEALPARRQPSKPDPRPEPVQQVVESETKDLIGRVEDWPALSKEKKEEAMAKLQAEALGCSRCSHLVESRTQVVFGVGDIHAELMFVGEAPGMDEDRQGEPFVGKAGQLLTRIIETMGLSRDRVYIGNVLKCRPDTPGRRFGNRKPTPMEMQTCWPYLMEQIKLIRPKVMVALGATAVEGLLGKKTVGITRMRGQFQDFRGIPVMPTYHPAYVLRNPAKAVKRQVWDDMLRVMDQLGMTITTKQRQFFTK